MRVVIAPDSFKGSASAAEVAAELAAGWRERRPDDVLQLLPMADGGEGTLDAFEAAVDGARRMPVTVTGPDNRRVAASWLLLPSEEAMSGTGDASGTGEASGTDASGADASGAGGAFGVDGASGAGVSGGHGSGVGVVELASTSGITLLDGLRPRTAHTLGFGQAIADALDYGVSQLLLAIGGSASTDAGTAALTALGVRFLDRDGVPVTLGGAGLPDIATADLSGLRPLPPGGVRILSDVTNPLCGPAGAAAVFGEQKGADAAGRAALDAGLAHLVTVLDAAVAGAAAADAAVAGAAALAAHPGAGAAGGTGFGLMLWGAGLVAGAVAVGDALHLAEAVAAADVVITGEGRFDGQSAGGKAPAYVAGLPSSGRVLLVAGGIDAPTDGFAHAVSLTELAGSVRDALAEPRRWLRAAGAVLAARTR